MTNRGLCSECKYGGTELNFMHLCSLLGYGVVANRKNKKINKKEVCRAEELGKGCFALDNNKITK